MYLKLIEENINKMIEIQKQKEETSFKIGLVEGLQYSLDLIKSIKKVIEK